jgi:hypothetical protein
MKRTSFSREAISGIDPKANLVVPFAGVYRITRWRG